MPNRDADPAAKPVPRAALRAPRLPEAGLWFNGGPVREWRGLVTLVDFWAYSCINCLRTLPALREWHARYAAHGLTILGIHTPEFPFEREPANVARALDELGITYPVVLDNDRALWERFANRYWPHRYLIDQDGRIVHDRAGEGGEAATERAIRALLAALPTATPLPPPAFPGDTGDEGAWKVGAMGAVCVPGTPELFAGYYRGVSGNPDGFREDRAVEYTDPGGYREGYIHLAGVWCVDADAAHFTGPGPGYLRLAFRGTAPNVVLAPGDAAPADVAVQIMPPTAQTPAISASPGTTIAVDAPRLYRLPPAAWRDDASTLPATALRLLTLIPASPGLAVYSFTFGAC